MKRLMFLIAFMAVATPVANAAESFQLDPAVCMGLAEQYRKDSEGMTFSQMDELRNCISTIAQMKASEKESEKADRAIIKLYGLNG